METTQALVTLNGAPLNREAPVPEYDPFCYVCGRCTDHTAEHDDLVEAGLAEYREGDVRWLPAGEARYDAAFTAVCALPPPEFVGYWTYDAQHDAALGLVSTAGA